MTDSDTMLKFGIDLYKRLCSHVFGPPDILQELRFLRLAWKASLEYLALLSTETKKNPRFCSQETVSLLNFAYVVHFNLERIEHGLNLEGTIPYGLLVWSPPKPPSESLLKLIKSQLTLCERLRYRAKHALDCLERGARHQAFVQWVQKSGSGIDHYIKLRDDINDIRKRFGSVADSEEETVEEKESRSRIGSYSQTLPERFLLAAQHDDQQMVEDLMAANHHLVSTTNKAGWSPLMVAAFYGSTGVCKILLTDASVDVNSQSAIDGVTPLMLAARSGREETVSVLLARQADPTPRDVMSRTALWFAAESNNTVVVNLVVDGWRRREGTAKGLNELQKEMERALLAACGAGLEVMAKYLLEKGVAATCRGENEATPLIAAARNGHTHLIPLLLEAGAKINSCTKDDGQNALMHSLIHGHYDTAKMLIESRADITQKTKDGRTTLCIALGDADAPLDLLKLLAKQRPKFEPDKMGFTPLHYALAGGCTKPVLDLLIDLGAAPVITRQIKVFMVETENPLLLALIGGASEEVVACLLSHGATLSQDPKKVDWMFLCLASQFGSVGPLKTSLETAKKLCGSDQTAYLAFLAHSVCACLCGSCDDVTSSEALSVLLSAIGNCVETNPAPYAQAHIPHLLCVAAVLGRARALTQLLPLYRKDQPESSEGQPQSPPASPRSSTASRLRLSGLSFTRTNSTRSSMGVKEKETHGEQIQAKWPVLACAVEGQSRETVEVLLAAHMDYWMKGDMGLDAVVEWAKRAANDQALYLLHHLGCGEIQDCMTHNGTSCAKCGCADFVGPRFHCLHSTCPFVDLCRTCANNSNQTHRHLSLVYRAPVDYPCGVQVVVLGEPIKTLESEGNGANSEKVGKDDLHVGVTCSVCKREDFFGARFHCLHCRVFDLCEECFSNKSGDISEETKTVKRGQHVWGHAMLCVRQPIRGLSARLLPLPGTDQTIILAKGPLFTPSYLDPRDSLREKTSGGACSPGTSRRNRRSRGATTGSKLGLQSTKPRAPPATPSEDEEWDQVQPSPMSLPQLSASRSVATGIPRTTLTGREVRRAHTSPLSALSTIAQPTVSPPDFVPPKLPPKRTDISQLLLAHVLNNDELSHPRVIASASFDGNLNGRSEFGAASVAGDIYRPESKQSESKSENKSVGIIENQHEHEQATGEMPQAKLSEGEKRASECTQPIIASESHVEDVSKYGTSDGSFTQQSESGTDAPAGAPPNSTNKTDPTILLAKDQVHGPIPVVSQLSTADITENRKSINSDTMTQLRDESPCPPTELPQKPDCAASECATISQSQSAVESHPLLATSTQKHMPQPNQKSTAPAPLLNPSQSSPLLQSIHSLWSQSKHTSTAGGGTSTNQTSPPLTRKKSLPESSPKPKKEPTKPRPHSIGFFGKTSSSSTTKTPATTPIAPPTTEFARSISSPPSVSHALLTPSQSHKQPSVFAGNKPKTTIRVPSTSQDDTKPATEPPIKPPPRKFKPTPQQAVTHGDQSSSVSEPQSPKTKSPKISRFDTGLQQQKFAVKKRDGTVATLQTMFDPPKPPTTEPPASPNEKDGAVFLDSENVLGVEIGGKRPRSGTKTTMGSTGPDLRRGSYTVDELRIDRMTLKSRMLDVTRLEDYLGEDDFASVFQMTRQEFNGLPKWRQRELKKAAGLF